MNIRKVVIENFKCFHRPFSLELGSGINVLVGCNEAGKTTIIEAINLALTGCLYGRFLRNELSTHLFNLKARTEYLERIKSEPGLFPPSICVELYITDDDSPEVAYLRGDNNSERTSAAGMRYRILLDEQYRDNYLELIKNGHVSDIPLELYTVRWDTFSRIPITSRSCPLKVALIDSQNVRTHASAEASINRIVREGLTEDQGHQLANAQREMLTTFRTSSAVREINQRLSDGLELTNKALSIDFDLSGPTSWADGLATYLDSVPFEQAGRGEQCTVKTALALARKRSIAASFILIEEPENHLSHVKLNELLSRIAEKTDGKQLLITTHSSFVANKLMLNNLVFLERAKCASLRLLSAETQEFFSKLAGYDTLRLILAPKVVLVEGDSDELVFQRAFMDQNDGKLPIECNVDVISVGTSFLRFLELAKLLDKRVVVVTDNDGDVEALKSKYRDYLGDSKSTHVDICFDPETHDGPMKGFNYNTLEPRLVASIGREKLNSILSQAFTTDEDLLKYMRRNKTECALRIFNATEALVYPSYITEAIKLLARS